MTLKICHNVLRLPTVNISTKFQVTIYYCFYNMNGRNAKVHSLTVGKVSTYLRYYDLEAFRQQNIRTKCME